MTEDSPKCVVAVLGLVLGPGGVPSPALRARCERAAQVASERDATVIPTGGDAARVGVTEARVMADILVGDMGVREERLLLEEEARSTVENAINILR